MVNQKGTVLVIIDRVLLFLSCILLFLLIWDSFISQNLHFLYNLLYTPIWVAFTLEYLIKLFLSKKKYVYIRDNLLSVFIIIFPFLRPLRLLAVSRFGLAVIVNQLNERLPWIKKYRVIEVILFTGLFLILSSDLLLLFEKEPGANIKTFSNALWFSISTLSTTGYGDVYPKSNAGRILATVLILFGISLFELLTAKLASFFVDVEVKQDLKGEEKEIERLSSQEEYVRNLVSEVLSQEKKMELEIKDIKKN